MVLFTHGSFYLWNKERKELLKISGTRYNKIKKLFDRLFMKKILMAFDIIVTLSNDESSELSELFNIPEDKFLDLGNFSDEIHGSTNNTLELADKLKNEYLLYIGRLDKRKNLLLLIEAGHKLNIPVIIAGQDKGELVKLKNYAANINFDKFYYLGVIGIEEKFTLIRNARATVIPSFFEGLPTFGIESLKIGTKVFLTKNSYMKKHPCVYLIDPTNHNSLIEQLSKFADGTKCEVGYESNLEVFNRFISAINDRLKRSL